MFLACRSRLTLLLVLVLLVVLSLDLCPLEPPLPTPSLLSPSLPPLLIALVVFPPSLMVSPLLDRIGCWSLIASICMLVSWMKSDGYSLERRSSDTATPTSSWLHTHNTLITTNYHH
jgi:hypothetical protein